MQNIKRRTFSMVTALMLVFTLFSLLPQGALKASAAGSRYCFTDENGIEWTFTASGDIRFSDARIVSVRDTLGRDSDSDPTNDITELNVPDKVLDDYNSYTHAVTEIGCDYADNVPVQTFSSLKKLKKVVLPYTLKTVGERTFKEHPTLEDVFIPSGVKMIGTQAFFGCEKLASIHIPSTVTRIVDYAFDSCSSLDRIYISKKVSNIDTHAFDRISDDAVIYGYKGSAAEACAGRYNNIEFFALDDYTKNLPYYFVTENCKLIFTNKNTGNKNSVDGGIPKLIMNSVDKEYPGELEADAAPEGMTFAGYEIIYDLKITDNSTNVTSSYFKMTYTLSPDENTFSLTLPDEVYENVFPYVYIKLSYPTKFTFSNSSVVTVKPLYKYKLTVINGKVSPESNGLYYTEIMASAGDVLDIYARKPGDGDYYFKGWTADYEDPKFKMANSMSTFFTMPDHDATITANFAKGKYYSLYIDGVQTTTENSGDILGNGVFRFEEETKTLYINGDYSTEYSQLISASKTYNLDSLTIVVEKDSTLSARSHVIRMSEINATLKGSPKLTLKANTASIYLEKSDFKIIDANIDIESSYQGIGGYQSSSNTLTVTNSNISITTEKGEDGANGAGLFVRGAVCNMNKGITLVDTEITVPESYEIFTRDARSYIKDTSTGQPAKEIIFKATKQAQDDKQVGDVNGDGMITADDAIIVARLAAGYGDYAERYDSDVADMNQDGKVTADDAIIIARYAADYGNYREIYTKYI